MRHYRSMKCSEMCNAGRHGAASALPLRLRAASCCRAISAPSGTTSAPQVHVQSRSGLAGKLEALPFVMPAMSMLGAAGISHFAQVVQNYPGNSLPPWLAALLLGPPLIMFVANPALDKLLGPVELPAHTQAVADGPAGAVNPTSSSLSGFAARALPTAWVAAFCTASLLTACSLGQLGASGPDPLAQAQLLGLLVLGLGTTGAVGTAAAHELIHSRHPVHQTAGELMLAWVWFWPYSRSHHHHHLTVGTPDDHASAPLGQALGPFLWQYFVGNMTIAWEMECKETARKGHPAWSPYNRFLWGMAAQLGITAAVTCLGGWAALAVHCAAGTVAQLQLGVVDYVLHYGLQRPRKADGQRLSPVSHHSSYNSGYALENAMLFKVLMHSDHHLTASKPWGSLGLLGQASPAALASNELEQGQVEVEEGAELSQPLLLPKWPMSGVLALALVPPLWFNVVDPVSRHANSLHVRQQEVHPAK
ncbi:fatty acid desaturase-domain-containing protein [Haematococcus lacustris]